MIAKIIKCKAFIALAAFVLLSAVAAAVQLWQTAPNNYPYHSWTSWAIDDFVAQKQAPNMVFMGSSLMLVPLDGVDADFYGKKVDGAAHHNSKYFEESFGKATGVPVSTYNFALPGEMPSDAYLITKLILSQSKKPDAIVFGVGPRDFMDNLLPSAAATDPYRFLTRFVNVAPVANLAMPGWSERFNYELGRANYFYGNRTDICTLFTQFTGSAINGLVPKAKRMDPALVHQLIPEYKPFALEKEQAFFRPLTGAELASFTDNLEEYRKRYKTLNMATFRTQMEFMSRAMQTAKQQGVHVVLVAMPITDLNRELISDSAWSLYHESVKKLASNCGATLVDFSESSCFNRKDFGDTVHLHARGGRKFLDLLTERLVDDSQLLGALRQNRNAVELAGKNGGQL